MSEKEFIKKWTSKLTSDGIKNFPSDFTNPKNYKEIKLPGKQLLIGEELFGTYEILTTDSKSVFHAESYQQAEFIIYSNRNTPEIILIPENINELKDAVQRYEAYLDEIIKQIELDYQLMFSANKVSNSGLIVAEIFKIMNLVRM